MAFNQQPSSFGGFGTTTPGATTTFGSFGQQQQQPAQTTFGGFGAAARAPAAAFGTPTTTFGATPTTSFGTPGGFGAQPNTMGQPTTGLFAQPAQSQPFGQPAAFGQAAAAPRPAFGGFGATTGTATPGGFNFGGQQQQPGFGAGGFGQPAFGQPQAGPGTGNPPFQPVEENDPSNRSKFIYNSISLMPAYTSKCFEELRHEDYKTGNKGRGQAGAAAGAFGMRGATAPFGAAPAPSPAAFGGFGSTTSTLGRPLAGFGATPTAGFGAAPAPGGGLFGAQQPQQQQQGFGAFRSGTQTSPFGASTLGAPAPSAFGLASPSQPSSVFGGGAASTFGAKPATTFGGFGATNTATAFGAAPQQPGGFGGFGTTPQQSTFGAQPATTGGLFGGAAPAPSVFGGAQTGGGLFGGQQQSSLFGANQPKPGGLFGQPAATGFGGLGAQQQPQPTPFGGAATAGTTGGLFGSQPTAATGGGLFGGGFGAPAPAPAGGLFGGGATTFGATQPQQPQQTGGLFGGAGTTGFGASTGGGLFGSTPGTTSTFGAGGGLGGGLGGTTPSLFGGAPQAGGFGSTGGFGAPKPAGSLFGGAPAPATGFGTGGSLFGGAGGAATSFGGSTLGGFGGSTTGGLGMPSFQAPAPGSLFGAATGGFGAPQQQQPQQQPHPYGPGMSDAERGVLALNRRGAELESKLKSVVGMPENTALGRATDPKPPKPTPSSSPSDAAMASALASARRPVALASADSKARVAPRSERKSLGRALRGVTPTPTKGASAALVSSLSRRRLVIEPNAHSRSSAQRDEVQQIEDEDDDDEPGPVELPPWAAAPATVENTARASISSTTQRSADRATDLAATPAQQLDARFAELKSPDDDLPPQLDDRDPPPPPIAPQRPPPTPIASTEKTAGNPLEEPPNPKAPKLTKVGYVTEPAIEVLEAMSDDELAAVHGFVVSRPDYGKIEWLGRVDVRGVDLDRDVRICESGGPPDVQVYDDDDAPDDKPPLGHKLNNPAIVSLDNVGPQDPQSTDESTWTKRIQRAMRAMPGCDLVSYDFHNRLWKFKAAHF